MINVIINMDSLKFYICFQYFANWSNFVLFFPFTISNIKYIFMGVGYRNLYLFWYFYPFSCTSEFIMEFSIRFFFPLEKHRNIVLINWLWKLLSRETIVGFVKQSCFALIYSLEIVGFEQYHSKVFSKNWQ